VWSALSHAVRCCEVVTEIGHHCWEFLLQQRKSHNENIQLFFTIPIINSLFPSGFSTTTWHIILLHVCHMPHLSHHPRFDQPDDICWGLQIMKLLIMQSSPPSCYFSPVGQNSFMSILFSNTFSLHFSLNVTNQVSHPYERGGKI
jgi:hypothetical protein